MQAVIQKSVFLLLATAATAAPARAQLRIELTPPRNTPPTASVYVAGSFNLWQPAAPGYRLARDTAGHYSLVLPDSVRGPLEFKFTLGSWENVEISERGADVPNRTVTVPDTGLLVYAATVGSWKIAPRAERAHTASPSVRIMADSFAIPQLGRSRRVWIYLPKAYATSRERYPVLYMQDGQNVFDNATSYVGEWGVDETLDSLQAGGDRGVIVVAVDHGGDRRMNEYNRWTNTRFGSGEGAPYVEFLVKTLKPYIDQHYRTLPDRAHTAIAGSSMGGLISYYAALAYPDVFGAAGVFSPSFWIAPEVLAFTHDAALPHRPRLYIVSAADESGMQKQKDVYLPVLQELAAKGYGAGDLVTLIRPDGAHSEWFWRREFPAAYQWLLPR